MVETSPRDIVLATVIVGSSEKGDLLESSFVWFSFSMPSYLSPTSLTHFVIH